ncbi:MAG TPA: BatD family protein [Candidatus Saccharimonadales bacterium]|nr:BatD family protein [Candidatus Saccharimonadales bacterium]
MERLRGTSFLYWSGRKLILFPVCASLCLVLLWMTAVPTSAATFTASLDNDTLTLGQSTTLSLTFQGGSPQNVPTLPDIPGLQITYVGPSSQFSFINGQTSSTVTHHFTVTPERAGDFTIPALTADVDGTQLTSQPLQLQVVQPSAASAAQINSGSQIAFMKLSLPYDKVYDGEAVTADLDIYLRDDVRNFGNFQFTGTPADGFTVGKMNEGQPRREQIGNRVYTVIPVSMALTAAGTGALSVGPLTASLTIVVASANQPNDPFFRQFGIQNPFGDFNEEQKQISLATEPVNVESLPLPANNVPSSFNGAIGEYTMTVAAGPTNVAVGDPITVHIEISGRGDLASISLPNQSAWRNFTIYPPTSKLMTTDPLGLQGTKTFEEIVTPQNTDVRELPPFAFSYFDPDTGNYRTLTEPSVELAVHSAGTTPVPTIVTSQTANQQNPPAPEDILPIKQELGTLAQAGPPLVTRPAFLAVQSLPVLAFLAAFVWRKRTDNLANNPRLRRQRQVAQLVNDGVNDLRRLATENNSDEFFAKLFHLLQEQLGERLDSPASSITESVVDDRMVALGVSESTLNGLRELFQFCNQARYAPIRGSAELNSVVGQFEKVIGELREFKK